jgi:hypothetical protein
MDKNIHPRNPIKSNVEKKRTVGWREWVSLPDLEIPRIKAKLDTGARTSALHTYFIEPLMDDKQPRVRFGVHPLQHKDKPEVVCVADIIDQRRVTDSGGHPEMRFVIRTELTMGEKTWPIELSLTNREHMRFRLLLGRTAIREFLNVDPALSFTLGRPTH